VTVENSKSGKSIYELRTLLFDLPDSTLMNESSSRKDPAKSKKREGRSR
jgi:hypothetical protein